MTAIYKKEVLSFFRSMMGYLYTAFLLLIAGVFFTAFNLPVSYTHLDVYKRQSLQPADDGWM